MTEKKQGRPFGAGYDKYLDVIADVMVASGNTKNLPIVMRELFPLTFKFDVSRSAALRRIRAHWKRDGSKHLAAAVQRVSAKVQKEAKAKTDLLLLKDATALLKLTKEKVDPISENSNIAITMVMPPVTPEDYKANPMVPLLMSYGQFQLASERRYIAEKRKKKTIAG